MPKTPPPKDRRTRKNAPKYKETIIYSKEQLDEIRRKNRNRSKAMERRVTRYLNAQRTPMSGAGIIKSDGIGALPSGGIYLIECKLSEKVNRINGAVVGLQYGWIFKLRKEVDAMKSLGARFGIFVVHWHGYQNDVVLIDLFYRDELRRLTGVDISATLDVVGSGTRKDGEHRRGINLFYHRMPSLPHVMQWHKEQLVVMSLEMFKEILDRGEQV